MMRKGLDGPRVRLALAVVMLTLLALPACAPAATPTPAPTPIVVQLAWTHQAQFAGLYAAEQQGYYVAEGLGVSFVEGGPTVDLTAAVVAGTAQFGLTTADNLIAVRAQGKPVRAFATIYRRSPRIYMALADSGISRPQDFVGKTLAVNSTALPMLKTILGRAGVSYDQVTIVDLSPDLAPFYARQTDVRVAFLNNDVLTAQRAGYKLNLIYPDDYGVHFYGDVLFASDDFIVANPDLVERFLRASLKGWSYAVEHAAEMGALMQKYRPAADAALENDKMAASLPLINTGEDHIGWMKPEIWAGMEATLREQGVLTQTLDVTQAYTTRFVEEIYGR